MLDLKKITANLPIDHLSYSSIRYFHTDKHKFLQGYIFKKWDFDSKPAFYIGKVCHHAIELMRRSVMEKITDEEWEAIKADNFVGATTKMQSYIVFDDIMKQAFEYAEKLLTDEPIDRGKTQTPETAREDIIITISEYYKAIPILKPLMIEETILLEIQDGLPVKTIIDLYAENVDGQKIIVDHKTVDKPKTGEYLAGSYYLQGGTYIASIRGKGLQVDGSVYHEIIKGSIKNPLAYTKQAELRELCTANGIDWENGNNGKWMTNELMANALVDLGVVEMPKRINEYRIDNMDLAVQMFIKWYWATLTQLYFMIEAGADEDLFLPDIFSFFDGDKCFTDYVNKK